MAGESPTDGRFDVPLRGVAVDSETRCAHYLTERDVIAIAFPCCGTFYPCFECHETCCEQQPRRWPPDRFDERAILCGVCREVLTIETYLASEHRCPNCEAAFNPGCANHWDRYFRIESDR
jgi:uncharacterized CHY-type Zn-finger protein